MLLALLGLATVAAAVPATVQKTGISIPLRAPRAPAGMDDLAVVRHEHRRSLAKHGYGHHKRNVDLKSWEVGYTISVEVGTPPQTFDVIPDTGSYNFWLIGACDDTTECGTGSVFHANASSSFQPTDMPFEASYIDGGLQRGTWAYDQVGVGGQVVNASVGISNATLNWGSAMDGIMGFGPGFTNPNAQPWWFSAMGGWEDKQFGMHLGRIPPTLKANGTGLDGYGDLTLGGVNRSLFTGNITYYSALPRVSGQIAPPPRP